MHFPNEIALLLLLVSFYSKFIILSFQISPFLPYPQLKSLYGVAKEPYLKGKLPLLVKIVVGQLLFKLFAGLPHLGCP